jgi:ABC-type Fe3+-hydroxamate transport system substrate-binding protein
LPKIFNEILNQWVYLPEKPKRIVSLAPSITDTLVELGLIGKIVGGFSVVHVIS